MKTVFIIAGETSGDHHAAALVEALKRLNPEIEFLGLGGQELKQAGVKLFFNITDLAVIGFFEVLKNIKKFRQIFSHTLKTIKKTKPACCILVDYPGFNLRLARKLKRIGIPVVYYISPQVWAWNKRRINLIKACVDKMIVLFEFEKEFYKEFDIEAEFVGHPLLDIVEANVSPPLTLKKLNLRKGATTFALMPGSRKKEIYMLLPIMLEAARIITRDAQIKPQFILIQSNTVKGDSHIVSLLDKFKDIELRTVSEEDRYDCLFASDLAIITSGTATLETALLSTPMIIIYKLNLFSWLLARLLIRIPYIGLVNVVAGEKIIPELIQFKARPSLIARESLKMISDRGKLKSLLFKLDSLKKKLGAPGASQRAAEIINRLIT